MTNFCTKLCFGVAAGTAGVLAFRSPRLRTLFLGVSTGVAGGYAWHQNSMVLADKIDKSVLSSPTQLLGVYESVHKSLPEFFRIK